ncbi:hypothetical protein AB0J47_16170 [Nocardia sp. NPDC049737]|uniref:hypothetical protein n=1 Tax=Nocardia sp. NPDC049737 TaxID=3154358 RepID=UPI0034245215
MASAANAAFCRNLGAEHTFDYTDPEALTGEFDAILDCHGGSLATYRGHVRRGDRIMSIATAGIRYALRSAPLPGPRVRCDVGAVPPR